MHNEVSLPHAQETATCPCPELEQPVIPKHQSKSEVLWNVSQYRKFLRWWFVSTSPNSPAGRTPFVSCPRLFIQYTNIPSYHPHLRAVPPTITWEFAQLSWQEPAYRGQQCSKIPIHITWRFQLCSGYTVRPGHLAWRNKVWHQVYSV